MTSKTPKSPAQSLYEIPEGCICMGDGLMGMPCTAKKHAYLKDKLCECGHSKSKHYKGRGMCESRGHAYWATCICRRFRLPRKDYP